jgi:hypothetical protein
MRTLPTGLNAIIHVADLFAAIGAGVAYLSACMANGRMQRRIAQHEVSGGLADLCAIDH